MSMSYSITAFRKEKHLNSTRVHAGGRGGKKTKKKKTCWNRKRKSKKDDGTYRQRGSDTSAEVYVC